MQIDDRVLRWVAGKEQSPILDAVNRAAVSDPLRSCGIRVSPLRRYRGDAHALWLLCLRRIRTIGRSRIGSQADGVRANKHDRCKGRLAKKLVAEKCSLEAEVFSHFSAIHFSAQDRPSRRGLLMRRPATLAGRGGSGSRTGLPPVPAAPRWAIHAPAVRALRATDRRASPVAPTPRSRRHPLALGLQRYVPSTSRMACSDSPPERSAPVRISGSSPAADSSSSQSNAESRGLHSHYTLIPRAVVIAVLLRRLRLSGLRHRFLQYRRVLGRRTRRPLRKPPLLPPWPRYCAETESRLPEDDRGPVSRSCSRRPLHECRADAPARP